MQIKEQTGVVGLGAGLVLECLLNRSLSVQVCMVRILSDTQQHANSAGELDSCRNEFLNHLPEARLRASLTPSKQPEPVSTLVG